MTILGIDRFRNSEVAVSEKRRQSGMYVVGVQGVGKSRYMESLIYQDICKGYPVIVIDPHADLVRNIIAQMPEDKVAKTFLLDLSDEDWPFGVNLFALSNSDSSSTKNTQMAIDRVMHVFERLFPGGERTLLDKLILYVTITMFDNPGHSIADIPRLLNDDRYRSRLVRNVKNRHVRSFWEHEYNAMSVSSRKKDTYALGNRLARLLTNKMLENIIAQKTTTIDFRKSIDRAEIILIRLPVNEFKHIAPIVGTMLMAEVYAATFSYVDTALDKRPGFSLYVDEFEYFSTSDFAEMFSGARKFGARLCVGHQYRDQLTEDNKSATLTAGTLVSFQVIHNDARELSSSFVDQAAIIREKVVLPDALKFLSSHSSDRVRLFSRRYVSRMQERSKEPIQTLLAYTYPDIKTVQDSLRFLERVLVAVQTHGYLREEKTILPKPTWGLYCEVGAICANFFGFAKYYLDRFGDGAPARKRLEAQTTQTIAKLNEEIAEKQTLVAYDTAFLSYFSSAGYKEAWHKEEAQKETARGNLPYRLISFLSLNELSWKLPLPEVTWHVSRDTNWYELDAVYHKKLAQFANVENLARLKVDSIEALTAQLEVKIAQYEQEREDLLFRGLWPFRSKYSRQSIQHRGREVDKSIEALRLEQEKLFQSVCVDWTKDEGLIRLASDIARFSRLDSPGKIISLKKLVYRERVIAPLKEQIEQVQAAHTTELSRIEKALETENALYEAFNKSYDDCVDDLVASPICEQKPLTASDTAMILEHLPARHALVRVGKSDQTHNEPSVFLIKTLDAPERVTQEEFDRRFEAIRAQTREKYCRSRVEIEAEIHASESSPAAGDDGEDNGEDFGFNRFEDE